MRCGCGWLKVLDAVRMLSVVGIRCGVDVVGWKY